MMHFRRLLILLILPILVLILPGTVPVFAQVQAVTVQEALGLISFLRSLGGGGGDSGSIPLEFDAIHLKLDQILENQERLQKGILLLSEQMQKMEKALIDDMRELPNREVKRKLSAAQARVRTISASLDHLNSLSPALKTEYLKAVKVEIGKIKEDISGVMEDVLGISAAYTKAKYSFISAIASTAFDVLMSMELTEAFIRQHEHLPRPQSDKPWYFLQYQSIVSVLGPFETQDTLIDTHWEILNAYRKMRIQPNDAAQACFAGSGLEVSNGSPYEISEALFNEDVNKKSPRKDITCLFTLSPASECGGEDQIQEHSIQFGEGEKNIIQPFDLKSFSRSSEEYLLVAQQQRDDTFELGMIKLTLTFDTPVGVAISSPQNSNSQGGSICQSTEVVEVRNLRSEADRLAVTNCGRRGTCPFDVSSSELRQWWYSYRDQTALQMLNINTVSEAVAAMRRVKENANSRISVLLAP